MSSSSSSLYRRLHGLFNLPRSSATKPIKTNPSPPSSTAVPKKPTAAAASSSPGSPLTLERRLQKLVNKFIKNSDSDRFRARHGIYDSTVRRLAVHKRFSMIEDIIEAQKKYEDIRDEGFAIRLIMLYGKAGMFTHARKLFDELPELNCERTVKSFNALLASCVNSKEFDQVETIFWDVPEKVSIEPNVISYNIVINAYCEMDALDKAFLFFNDMEKNGMEPDLVTFNTLLAAFYRKGQFLDGENMWNMLESKNMAPNLISYNARLRGMVQENKIQEGIGLLAEMEEKGIKPDVSSFNAMIKGFCEDGNLEEAKKWYYKSKENEATPNRSTYRALLPLLCEQGDSDMALELCKEAIDNRVVINVAEVQRVVDGLVKVSKIEEAEELVKLCNSNNYLNFKLELPQTST
ncbi:pentatricopeptide repeat-containing protein At1g55890, mitochondrial-like [Momordica charantia]|uniref:Pentatricopeptide repeat-containing protein At1g55890, mitochondrial-like n=1 Tax=Momordica charantia TaxID=3673 RepID=A0A6J1CLV6_MOMCH|nr:pentatricopeptide repeat-containing protein At1g55890, mitochondrial-like [Momordica charantia]